MKEKSMNRFFWARITALFSVFAAITTNVAATPINNFYEPVTIHTPMGSDKFFTPRKMCEVNFSLSPYYLHSATAKNGLRKKVPGGERLGLWNMFGVFYDLDTMSEGSPDNTYTQLDNLRTTLAASSLTGGIFEGVNFVTDSSPIIYPDPSNQIFIIGGTSLSTTTTTMIGSFSTLPVDYEKIGMRSQVSVDLGMGCGIIAKGGIADCKATPKFLFNSGFMQYVTGTPDAPTPDQSIRLIYDNLLSTTARNTAAAALGIDIGEYRKTGFEDTHIQAYWEHPFNLKDREGDIALIMIPHLSIGAWVPTAPKTNVDKIFAAPLGSNGFLSWTAEGALSFDFPQSIQVSIGGGTVISESKTVWQRMPSSIYQSGIYPWKTMINKRPGTTWYVNSSFKAENFIDGLSCYFDYIFTEHLKDSLTLRESNANRLLCFQSALDKAVHESAWRSQQWNAGLNYKVTDMLSFGCAVQSHVTGVRVFRPTTILGSMTLNF